MKKNIDDNRQLKKNAENRKRTPQLTNLLQLMESRIYANLSKQLVDNMFGENMTQAQQLVQQVVHQRLKAQQFIG